MGNVLATQFYRITCSRVSALPRLTVVKGETAKPPDFDALASRQGLGHVIDQQLYRQLLVLLFFYRLV